MNFDLYTILDDPSFRSKPAMYFGLKDILHLRSFLSGVEMVDHFGGCEVVSEPPLWGMHEFVRLKYGFEESTAGWANLLLWVEQRDGHEGAGVRAVDRFFRDLDEYRGKKAT